MAWRKQPGATATGTPANTASAGRRWTTGSAGAEASLRHDSRARSASWAKPASRSNSAARRRFRPVEDDVEAAVEQGHGDPGAPAGGEDVGEQSPQGRQQGHDPRIENEAGGKVHDRMAAGFGEAQRDPLAARGPAARR